MNLINMQLHVPYPEEERIPIIKKYMSEYHCSFDQALKIDYDINWAGPIARRFLLETNCTVAMFLRLLGKYKNEDTRKIVVDCVGKLIGKGGTAFGVCLVEQIVDYNGFFLKGEYEKKQFTLNVIKEAMSKIAQEKEWAITPFEEVYNKIIELNYKNHWTWKKKLNNRSRRFTAEVYLEHEIENIKIYILIRNKQDQIVKKQLIITKPPNYSHWDYLGKLRWLSNDEVQLVNKHNTLQWNVQLQ